MCYVALPICASARTVIIPARFHDVRGIKSVSSFKKCLASLPRNRSINHVCQCRERQHPHPDPWLVSHQPGGNWRNVINPNLTPVAIRVPESNVNTTTTIPRPNTDIKRSVDAKSTNMRNKVRPHLFTAAYHHVLHRDMTFSYLCNFSFHLMGGRPALRGGLMSKLECHPTPIPSHSWPRLLQQIEMRVWRLIPSTVESDQSSLFTG